MENRKIIYAVFISKNGKGFPWSNSYRGRGVSDPLCLHTEWKAAQTSIGKKYAVCE